MCLYCALDDYISLFLIEIVAQINIYLPIDYEIRMEWINMLFFYMLLHLLIK